jgi:hypothetical protein
MTHGALYAELQALPTVLNTHQVYEKIPHRGYERCFKLHVAFVDGTSVTDDCEDSEQAIVRFLTTAVRQAGWRTMRIPPRPLPFDSSQYLIVKDGNKWFVTDLAGQRVPGMLAPRKTKKAAVEFFLLEEAWAVTRAENWDAKWLPFMAAHPDNFELVAR